MITCGCCSVPYSIGGRRMSKQAVCMTSNFQDEPGGDHFTAGADKARPDVDHPLIPEGNNR
jgi:hypothetical protein